MADHIAAEIFDLSTLPDLNKLMRPTLCNQIERKCSTDLFEIRSMDS